mmetsp:Transcript_17290/g.36078  ORF Transcript_17290/g.36078 Transcript_17290/m.36078 type:complete len:398 (+) Transcript_17290:174-1367(+)
MLHPSTRMAALATFLALTSHDDTSFARAFSIPAIIQASSARTRKSASSTQASLYIERGGEDNYHFQRSSQNTNMTATTTWPSLLSSSQAVLEPEPPSPVAMNDAVMEYLVDDKFVLDEANAVLEMGAVDQEEEVIHYDDFQDISSSASIHADTTPTIPSDNNIPIADSHLSPNNNNMGDSTIPSKPFDPIKGQESTIANPNAAKKGPKVPKWKKSSSTAFRTTSYLDSLSTNTIKPKTDDAYPNEISSSSSSVTDPTTRDDTDKSLLKDLRNQEAQFRQSRREKFQKAVYEATRRTNPQEAIQNRMEQGEKMRKEKERKQLEKLYQERTERLERKKSLEKDRKDILERFQAERERIDCLKMQQDVTSIDASDDDGDGTDGGLDFATDFDDDNDTSDN